MAKEPVALHWADWAAEPGIWHGKLESEKLGTNLDDPVRRPGRGRRRAGPCMFMTTMRSSSFAKAGRSSPLVTRKSKAQAGDILMGPAQVPHKYHSLGPDRLETTNIHLSTACVLTRLDDPDAD